MQEKSSTQTDVNQEPHFLICTWCEKIRRGEERCTCGSQNYREATIPDLEKAAGETWDWYQALDSEVSRRLEQASEVAA